MLSPHAQFTKNPATRIALSRAGGRPSGSSRRPPMTIVRGIARPASSTRPRAARRVLPVAVERHQDGRAAGPGGVDAGADRGALAEPPGMAADLGAGLSRD